MKQNELEFPIKPYPVGEVAEMYGISKKTLKKWLIPFEKEIGERRGHSYTPKQMAIIFDKLGTP